jgi:hypothetical protein
MMPQWALRLLSALKINPDSMRADSVIKGTSKHARGKTKPHDWREKRKIRNKMALRSRKINRSRR